MKKFCNNKPTHDTQGNKYTSKNFIPKAVKTLFKKKCKLSKQHRTVTSIERCTNSRNKLLKIDIEISNHYNDRRNMIENKVLNVTKENKSSLYQHIKRLNKTKSKIGPFLNKGKVIDMEPCEILKSQYRKVFTNPHPNCTIEDFETFFKPTLECMDCDN